MKVGKHFSPVVKRGLFQSRAACFMYVALEGIPMRLRAAKWLAMSLVSLSAFAFASGSTEAEACCGLWQALFGWCGGCRSQCSPCGPAMGGCGPSGCPTASYYGPVVYGRCSPCAPSCSPCGIASGGCATGDCSVGSSSVGVPTAPPPEPNDKWNKSTRPRTYAPGSENAPDSDLGPSGPIERSGSDRLNQQDDQTFKKTRTGDDPDAIDDQGNASPASKTNDSNSSKAGRKGPPSPKASEAEAPDSSRAPTISVDDKVAWRTAPARTRLETRPRTASARIVRLPAYPKTDWLPVEGDSKIAKK